ncbi:probable N-acetyltransferase 16 [Denticeps clupeoides]|nr:probable N-acetyltransferase 16 [Denticeps clupeoides]
MEPDLLGESEELTFWLAKPEDYEDVMAISKGIFDGNDYLPHFYQEWMTEPNRVVIVARKGRKLVALESRVVVDGGNTVVLQGLRVCPSEAGHGLASVLHRFCDSYMKKLYPSIRMRHLITYDYVASEKLSKFNLLAKRVVLSFYGEAESFFTLTSTLKAKLVAENRPGGSDFKTCALETEDQLRSVILDPDLPSMLQLPGGAIIQDWQPLMPTETNMEILRRQNLSWFAARAGKKILFLSLHTPPYPIPYNNGSLCLNIDLFGTDTVLAKEAVVAHLERSKGQLRGGVVMHVYMHTSLWEDLREFCQGVSGLKQLEKRGQKFFEEKI